MGARSVTYSLLRVSLSEVTEAVCGVPYSASRSELVFVFFDAALQVPLSSAGISGRDQADYSVTATKMKVDIMLSRMAC